MEIDFSKIKGELYPYQKLGVEFFLNSNGRALLADEPGTGKAQPLWSKVLTPQGWKKMGNLKINDAVCMVDGGYSRVTGIFDRGIMDIYEVIFHDGSITHVSRDHLWKIQNRKSEWFVAPTWEVGTRLKKGQRIHIPTIKPSMGHGKKLLVPPYLLGLLLGDGGLTSNCAIITTTDEEIKLHCENSARTLGLKLNPCSKNNKNEISYRFTTGVSGRPNELINRLRKIDVWGKGSRTKIVPSIYLYSSKKQRLEILRGLMDTDGWISGDFTGFCSTSEKLADGVIQLVQSLGGTARKSYKKSVKAWNVSINAKINPFKLSRKANKWKRFTKYPATRIFKSIRKVGSELVRCISVSAPDRLYITDDYIVTHNTLQSLAYIVNQNHKRVLIITPASVKFVWEAEALKWTKLKTFVIDSKTDITLIPHDTELVIINYDILKKFYNELMKYKWDVLIADESHYCKSQSTIRSKIVKQLSRNIPHVLLLTGTPILSRPIEMFNLLNMIDPATWNNWYSYAIRYAGGKQGKWGFDSSGATNLEELKTRISKYFLRRKKEDVLKELPPKNRIEIPMELPAEERGQYHLVEENLIKYFKEYKKEKTDREIAKTLQGEKLVKLNLLREINSMGKIPTVKEMIQNILDAGEKVIVFSCFNAPLIELSEMFEEESVLLLGSTPIEDRQEMVRKFQEDPNTKIFFTGIKSGGTGITLTAASNEIFIDFSWTPSDHEQAEGRAHRPGAEYECLNIYQVVSRDTIDIFMKKLLLYKQEIITQLIENPEMEKEKTGSMIDAYLATLEANYEK